MQQVVLAGLIAGALAVGQSPAASAQATSGQATAGQTTTGQGTTGQGTSEEPPSNTAGPQGHCRCDVARLGAPHPRRQGQWPAAGRR